MLFSAIFDLISTLCNFFNDLYLALKNNVKPNHCFLLKLITVHTVFNQHGEPSLIIKLHNAPGQNKKVDI